MSSQYYNLRQAADRLGVSEATVRHYIRDGLIVVKRGPHSNSPIRINSLDLAAFDNTRGREIQPRGGTYFTLPEAASHLGISAKTVRRRIKQGLLRAKHGPYPNSPLRINSVDLAAYDRKRKSRHDTSDKDTEPPYVSMKEAAERLGVSTKTLDLRIREGYLTPRRDPGQNSKRFLSLIELDEFAHYWYGRSAW